MAAVSLLYTLQMEVIPVLFFVAFCFAFVAGIVYQRRVREMGIVRTSTGVRPTLSCGTARRD